MCYDVHIIFLSLCFCVGSQVSSGGGSRGGRRACGGGREDGRDSQQPASGLPAPHTHPYSARLPHAAVVRTDIIHQLKRFT